jgi:hypothetical protein
MLKTNLLGVVLAGTLALTALATAWLFFSYVQVTRTLPPLQADVLRINRNQAALQGLLGEAVEYSKRDPTIEPLLQSMGIRARTNAVPAPAKPAAK